MDDFANYAASGDRLFRLRLCAKLAGMLYRNFHLSKAWLLSLSPPTDGRTIEIIYYTQR
jgi:hypothetical protein